MLKVFLRFNLDAHLAGSATKGTECSFLALGIHVLHLDLHEIHDLLLSELGHLDFVRLLGTGSYPGGFLQENSGGRLLGDECKGFVLINRDDYWENVTGLLLRGCVELFTESHDIDTLLTERRTDRRRWIGLSGGDLKLDLSCDFFGHGSSFKKVVERDSRIFLPTFPEKKGVNKS